MRPTFPIRLRVFRSPQRRPRPIPVIKVNGVTVISGAASGNVPINPGINTVTTIVTPQPGLAFPRRLTTVTVRRGYMVTSAADTGAGSLRDALTAGADAISSAPA